MSLLNKNSEKVEYIFYCIGICAFGVLFNKSFLTPNYKYMTYFFRDVIIGKIIILSKIHIYFWWGRYAILFFLQYSLFHDFVAIYTYVFRQRI